MQGSTDYALLFLPGIILMAVLFSSGSLAADYWVERDKGTLRRLVSAPGALAVGEGDEVVELKEQKWAMPVVALEKPEPQFNIALAPVAPVGSLF